MEHVEDSSCTAVRTGAMEELPMWGKEDLVGANLVAAGRGRTGGVRGAGLALRGIIGSRTRGGGSGGGSPVRDLIKDGDGSR